MGRHRRGGRLGLPGRLRVRGRGFGASEGRERRRGGGSGETAGEVAAVHGGVLLTAVPCTSKRAPRTSFATPMNARAGGWPWKYPAYTVLKVS